MRIPTTKQLKEAGQDAGKLLDAYVEAVRGTIDRGMYCSADDRRRNLAAYRKLEKAYALRKEFFGA